MAINLLFKFGYQECLKLETLTVTTKISVLKIIKIIMICKIKTVKKCNTHYERRNLD